MKKKPLWEISLLTALEAEDSVVELLGRVFQQPTAVYTNEKTKITRASVYCHQPPELLPNWRANLLAGLKLIKSSGLKIGAAKIRVRPVAQEDWAESWKRHFKPIEIGSRLLIKPSWIKRRPKKNQAVVVLDPGLSFGTGNHPTTEFCLRELERHHHATEPQSFFDIGTGSGILAIAAAKLGYALIHAMDFDPEAVRVARENARRNGVLNKIILEQSDITKFSTKSREQFDFICANLISNLLIAEKHKIVNRLSPNGRLVLAGILREEFVLVQKAYEQLGLTLAKCRMEGEWRSGAFIFSHAQG